MSTKTRRPVAMSTPPPKNRSKPAAGPSYTLEEKQQLLDNFDLEIADKTRAFRSNLALAIQSFMVRQESEILRIPRELRTMTLGDLTSKWGGSFSGTVQRIQRERLERIERERAEVEEAAKKEAEEAAKGKRKRGTPDASPVRDNKNPRRGGTGKQTAQSSSTSTIKRKPTNSKRAKPVAGSSSKPPSSLPQDHIFNPLLPPTPRAPRPARRGESFLSVNGSPIQFAFAKTSTVVAGPSSSSRSNAPSHTTSAREEAFEVGDGEAGSADGDDDEEEDDEDEDEVDSDGDLPDVEAYEAKLEAARDLSKSSRSKPSSSSNSAPSRSSAPKSPISGPSTSSSASSSNASRKKRGPSLIFRTSLAGGFAPSSSTSARPTPANEVEEEVAPDAEVESQCSITLGDGTVISFNPLEVDRPRIEEEIASSGLSEEDKQRARKMIRDETLRALQARMEKWTV